MDKESRKQQILRCACTLFARQGFDATTVAQIAKQCGCSSPLVIRHFGSKDNIYLALLEQLRDACSEPVMVDIPAGGSTMEKLEALYNELVFHRKSLVDTHAELISALQSRGSTQELRAEAMRDIQDIGMDILLPVLREGVADGTFPPDFPCEMTARLLWLYINGAYMTHANYPEQKLLAFPCIREVLLNV